MTLSLHCFISKDKHNPIIDCKSAQEWLFPEMYVYILKLLLQVKVHESSILTKKGKNLYEFLKISRDTVYTSTCTFFLGTDDVWYIE